jgi:sugar phosphate isomerase/epimerase
LRHADQDLRVDDVPDGFEDELAATAGPARGAIFLTGPWHLTRVSHADRVYGVHVADRREPIRSDFDRGLPGDGSRAAVRTRVEAGYDGWFDVEVMSDDGTFGDAFPDSLWALPAEEIARRAVESMEAL